jgi:hypothetical protein
MGKMNWLIILGFILGVMSVASGFLIYLGQVKIAAEDKAAATREANENKDQIIHATHDRAEALNAQLQSLKNENRTLQDNLQKRDQKINEQTEKIIELNQELTNRTEKYNDEMKRYVLGDGYPIFGLKSQRGEFIGILFNDNRYPCYDVHVRIFDAVDYLKCFMGMRGDTDVIIDEECHTSQGYSYDVQSIPPVKYIFIDRDKFPVKTKEGGKGLKFGDVLMMEITINTRTVNTVQQMFIQLRKGFCLRAYRIWTSKLGTSLNDRQTNYTLATSVNEIPGYVPEWDKVFLPMNNRILKGDP